MGYNKYTNAIKPLIPTSFLFLLLTATGAGAVLVEFLAVRISEAGGFPVAMVIAWVVASIGIGVSGRSSLSGWMGILGLLLLFGLPLILFIVSPIASFVFSQAIIGGLVAIPIAGGYILLTQGHKYV